MAERLTEKQLLSAARRNGFRVTADQLKRWRRAQLIPRPDQSHPRGQRGSEATYPAGALGQLLLVCRLRHRFRKLDRIRFELWWADQYRGDLEPIRAFLVTQLEQLLAPIREHRDRFEDPFDAAQAAVAGTALESRSPALRAMRRLTKNDEDLRSAAHAILFELFGGEVPWDLDTRTGLAALVEAFGAAEVVSAIGRDQVDDLAWAMEPSLRALVERATGEQRAKADHLGSGGPLLLSAASVVDMIQESVRQRVLDLDDAGWAIRKASGHELEIARARGKLITEVLGAFAKFAAIRFGRDQAGLSVLRAVLTSTGPMMPAVAVQWALVLPSHLKTDDEVEHAISTFDAAERSRTELLCVELFVQEHPGYSFIFKSDVTERVQALTAEERQIMHGVIDNFLARHPECAALMTPEA